MLALIHNGVLLSRISELEPAHPELWTRGQIVYFAIDLPPLGDGIDQAILVSPAGFVWHVEVVASGPPRDVRSPAQAGVIVRVLRRLEATPALMDLIRDKQVPAIARFPIIHRGHNTAGAA